MPFPTASLVYTIPVRGAGTVAEVQAAVAAAPIPIDFLNATGIRVTSDVTTTADPVVRTIDLNMQPDVIANLTAAINQDDGTLASITVTNPGSGYIVAPVVACETVPPMPSFQAYLELVSMALAAGGNNYSAATTIALIGGLPGGTIHQDPTTGKTNSRTSDPLLGPHAVASVAVIDPGDRYDASDVVQFIGYGGRQAKGFPVVDAQGRIRFIQMTDMGLGYVTAPDVVISGGNGKAQLAANMCRGIPATASLTIGGGGVITAATLLTPGSGYVVLPQVVIFDPAGTGTGAVVTFQMGVERVDILNAGQGFSSPPTVAAINVYEAIFGQAFEVDTPISLETLLFPFINFVTQSIQSRVASPISVDFPL